MVAKIFASPSELAGLWRSNRRRFIHEALLIYLALGFVISPPALWSDVYYALLFPITVHFVWRNPTLYFRQMSAPMLIGSVLIAWFTITLLWDSTALTNGSSLHWVWSALCTFVYIHSLADALQTQTDFRYRLMRGLILAGMVNATIAFVRLPFFVDKMWGANGVLRMAGWSVTRHAILGAIIIGLIVIMAIDRALVRNDRGFWIAALVGLVFIALTGSRGPEIAVSSAIIVLLGWSRPRLLGLLVLVVMLAVSLFAFLDWSLLYHLIEEQLARGDSHRFIIWRLSWHDIMQHPWLGHGPEYRLDRPGEAFPHNLFLSTWLYTGLVGLGLLAAYLLRVLQGALASPNRAERAFNIAILVLLLLSAMTDYSQIIKGPGPMWYMFWLPTLLVACRVLRKNKMLSVQQPSLLEPINYIPPADADAN